MKLLFPCVKFPLLRVLLFSIFLFGLGLNAHAQLDDLEELEKPKKEQPKDPKKENPKKPEVGSNEQVRKDKKELKKTRKPFKFRSPNGLFLGADLYSATRAIYTPFRQFEASADAYWKKWHVVFDLGTYASKQEGTEGTDFEYRSTAVFGRIGAEINLLYFDFREEALIVGFKYGRSYYNERYKAKTNDIYFGENSLSSENKLNASWLELNLGIKFKVWKSIYTGYTLRYKMAGTIHGDPNFEPYRIPAYGIPGKGNFGFSYYLYYHLPIRKLPSPKFKQ